MPQADELQSPNILLSAVSRDDLALLRPHLIRVPLAREQVLIVPNQPIEHVYFPEGGICSVVSVMAASGRTEAGIFGREGFSAPSLLLGTDRTPYETFIQVGPLTALRIDTRSLPRRCRAERKPPHAAAALRPGGARPVGPEHGHQCQPPG